MNVSGKTASSTPCAAARSIASQTRSTVPVPLVRSGAICTAAALIRFILHRPGIDDRGARLLVHEDAIQHVERIDRDDAGDEGFFRLPVERLGGEAAAVNLAAFLHEFREALIDEEMAGKRLVAERRKAALEAERDAGAVKQDGGLVSFAQQARGHQRVDDPDRAFKGDGVKSDESFFAGIGFDVGKDFLFVIHEEVSGFVHFFFDFWHE